MSKAFKIHTVLHCVQIIVDTSEPPNTSSTNVFALLIHSIDKQRNRLITKGISVQETLSGISAGKIYF